ncbi:hypothetical protein ABPG72_000313 [Tetrahymena utriculariae]
MKLTCYQSVFLGLLLIASVVTAESLFPHDEQVKIKDGEEYVQTPFGLMLRECVQNVPSGTHIQQSEDGSIFLTNDQKNFVKKLERNEKCVNANPEKKQENLQGLMDIQILLDENNDNSGTSHSIIQPALIYTLEGWHFQSWNCCHDGQAFNSEAVKNVTSHDQVYGSLEVKNQKITIISENKLGKQYLLTVDSNPKNFDWVTVALEVYHTTVYGTQPVPQWDDP